MPQPCMSFISGKGSCGGPFAVLPLAAPSWCCCATACGCVWYLHCWLLFWQGKLLLRKNASNSAELEGELESRQCWHGHGPRVAPGAFLVLACCPLSRCRHFCGAGKAASAALAFLQARFRSGFPSNHYVLFGGRGFAPVEPLRWWQVSQGMAFGRPPTFRACPAFLCSRSSCSLSQLSSWLAHRKPMTINRWLEKF